MTKFYTDILLPYPHLHANKCNFIALYTIFDDGQCPLRSWGFTESSECIPKNFRMKKLRVIFA